MEYDFELSDEDQDRLFIGLKLVRLGDTVELIKQKLGPPSKEKIITSKEGKFQAYTLIYYVKQVTTFSANTNDQSIALFLDRDRTLREIAYNSIPPFFGNVITELTLTDDHIYIVKPPAS